MDKAEISKAAPEDAEKILEYLKTVGGETDNLTFGSEGLPLTVKEEAEYLRNTENSKIQLSLIAKYEDQVVGFAQYKGFSRQRLAHRGEISISVKKSMWGNHIASRIMSQLIEFARNTANAEIISLEVRSDNERAIALYKKFGFEKTGFFKGYMKISGKYIDCDTMTLYLKN